MKKCFACQKSFYPTGRNQIRCGSVTIKIGCSYDWFYFLKRHKKDGSPRPQKPNLNNSSTNYRVILFKERGLKCQKCGIEHIKRSFFEIDHIIPRFKIGSKRSNGLTKKEFPNLQILCPNCHKEKTIIDRNW